MIELSFDVLAAADWNDQQQTGTVVDRWNLRGHCPRCDSAHIEIASLTTEEYCVYCPECELYEYL